MIRFVVKIYVLISSSRAETAPPGAASDLYMRQEVKLMKGKRQTSTDLEDFLQNHVVLSDQKVSGSSKNSWR